MSIFKETLEDSIQTQLQARTLVISGKNGNRNQLLPWYLSKNSWVRMTSFVNYTSGTELDTNEKGLLTVKPDGAYKDNQLSKKYILEGGTLYTRSNNGISLDDATLRYGVGTPNAAYGGNIDVRANNTADPDYFRTFGIRPMPGITEMSLRTIGAYGSLFETTVKFYAWDINQLNELEILFMRPGYSVLLEWGWSQYIDYDDNFIKEYTPSSGTNKILTTEDIRPTAFNGVTINPFENLSQDDVYLKLEALRKKYKHNYDGMLGYVKNFNWTMMSNGGFDCQVTLISMGEAINTIKMSSNVNNIKTDIIVDPDAPSNYVYDDYENVLLSLKTDVDNKNYGDVLGIGLAETEYSGSWNYNVNYVDRETIRSTVNKYYPTLANSSKFTYSPQVQEVEFTEPSETGRFFEYLTLDVWLSIVSSYFNVQSTSKKDERTSVPLVNFQLPGDNDLCLACKDTVSVDPKVCQVKNNGAFKAEMSFLSFGPGYNPTINGINPPMYQFEDGNKTIILPDTYQFYDPILKAGKIKNIFVNISLLLQTYKDMKNASNDEGVIMLDYIKNVLNKISNALGGLNNLSLSTVGKTQRTMKVVDLYYLENGPKSKADQKYQFDLLGLGSICRNVSIQSQIFENQSTIVAIAAQSRANLADVYNSSQIYLNAGLEDRIALNKWQGEENQELQANKEDVFYQKLFNFMLYARDYLIGNPIPGRGNNNFRIKVDTSGQANPSSILRQSMLKYNSELNFKALIPFKLKITLDGIGGIVVGQIFTVKQNVLPKNYYDKQLGFVITQINHKLVKNDWETELDTQICILDQDRKILQDFINVDRKGFGKYTKKIQLRAILYPILVDFLEYQAAKSLIGFTYARASYSTAGSNLSIGAADFEYLNEVMYDYVINDYDNEVVKEYWEDNIPEFLNRPPGSVINDPNTTDNAIDEFFDFIPKWARAYKAEYSGDLTTKIINDKTLGDFLDFLINQYPNGYASTDDDYKDVSFEIQQITSTLGDTNTLQVFYPRQKNPSPISIYTGDDGKLDVKTIFSMYFLSDIAIVFNSQYDLEIYGFDKKVLRNRIERFINSNGSLKRVKDFWNSGVALQDNNAQTLKDLVEIGGTAMYGTSNSVIHSFPVADSFENAANGPVSLSNRNPLRTSNSDGTPRNLSPTQKPTPNSIQYLQAFNIGQRVAKNIYWTGKFQGGRVIRTFRNRTDIISTTNLDYYQ